MMGETAPEAGVAETSSEAGEAAPETMMGETAPEAETAQTSPEAVPGEPSPKAATGEAAPEAAGEPAPESMAGEVAAAALAGAAVNKAATEETAPEAVGALGTESPVGEWVPEVPGEEAGGEAVIGEPSGEIAAEEQANMPTPSAVRAIPIEKIEGIGQVYTLKLQEVGIKTTAELLERGKSRKGREELVEKTGISSLLILKWVNMADLMRIKGVGEEYSELLERSGVDTVKELRNRNPNNLLEAMAKENETHNLVRRLPSISEVESWVKEASESEPMMTY